jgi:hypothetical protein
MKIAVAGLTYMVNCRLEIGDMGDISEEVFKEGIKLNRFIKGKITFADDSSMDGVKEEVYLSDPVYRVGDDIVHPVAFRPDVYYAKAADFQADN